MSSGVREATETWTVLRLMLWSADYLQQKGVERARLDAEYLLAHVLGVGRLEMYLQHERPLESAELEAFRPLLKRRAGREPLQYILGLQAFRDLDLEVGPGVLIPRPETECLVEVVLGWARERTSAEGSAPGRPGGLSALDVGTGSGAIALALLSEGPFDRVVATDASAAALEVAARNRDAQGAGERLDLRSGLYYDPVASDERFDVVVSNPPYVADGERDDLLPEVSQWEPKGALFSGADGLDALREIVRGAGSVLRPEGLLAVEVGDGQAAAVVALVRDCGEYRDVGVHPDLAGRERIVAATYSAADHR